MSRDTFPWQQQYQNRKTVKLNWMMLSQGISTKTAGNLTTPLCYFKAAILDPCLNTPVVDIRKRMNSTIRKYSSRALIWVVTPIISMNSSGFRSFLGLVKFAFGSERVLHGQSVITIAGLALFCTMGNNFILIAWPSNTDHNAEEPEDLNATHWRLSNTLAEIHQTKILGEVIVPWRTPRETS